MYYDVEFIPKSYGIERNILEFHIFLKWSLQNIEWNFHFKALKSF